MAVVDSVWVLGNFRFNESGSSEEDATIDDFPPEELATVVRVLIVLHDFDSGPEILPLLLPLVIGDARDECGWW